MCHSLFQLPTYRQERGRICARNVSALSQKISHKDSLNVLLLFPLLSLRHRRQIISNITPPPLQVLVRATRDFHRLDPKVCECLGGAIDFLVDEFASDCVRVTLHEPQQSAQNFRDRLADCCGDVKDWLLFHDFSACNVVDLLHAVLRWSVQLVCLACCAVVIGHDLKCGTDVDCLWCMGFEVSFGQTGIVMLRLITYMDGPKKLTKTIRRDDRGLARKSVEQLILPSEHGRWPDNGRFREDTPHHFFALGLCGSC